ncbi:MAG: N-acetylmuramoyl-L-alanine amidase family protein [Hyphomicrobium sp.]
MLGFRRFCNSASRRNKPFLAFPSMPVRIFGSMHPLRMKSHTALRQAILRAVSEDNRALVGAPSRHAFSPPCIRRNHQPFASILHMFRRLFGVALLAVGAFVLHPAAVGTLAHRVEIPSVPQQRDDKLSDIPVLAEPPRPSLSLQGGSPVRSDGLSSLESGEENAPAWDYPLPAAAATMPMSALFGLKVRTIVVDAGHGGRDPGAVGVHGPREKDLTLDIARRLASRLERDGRYRIVLTRSGDDTVPLARRVERAAAAEADLFVSIHVNALPNRNVNVIETYYFDFSQDPAALQLAAIENRDSEMPVGYFRTLLEKIGDTVKLQESRVLAQNIQGSLINNVKDYDEKVFDSGVKVAPFVVLMGVGVPAVLVEVSCLSNPKEEEKLRTPQYREDIASFLDEGITSYLDQRQLQARGPGYHERKDAAEIAGGYRQGS